LLVSETSAIFISMKDTTNDKGDIGVAAVIADLTSKGIKIALPISSHLPFDLIAISPDYKTSRVSVKYVDGEESIMLSLRTISACSIEMVRYVNLSHIDAYAAYSPVKKEVYYVNKKEFENVKTGLTLRLAESTINDKRIHFAKNYKDVSNLWKCG